MAYLGGRPARTPVTSAQITDASVTAAKLADDSVTTDKIAAANVTTAKITDANVTAAKLAASSALVGRNLIQNGAMTVAQRGTVFPGLGGGSAYTLDRWTTAWSAGTEQGRFQVTQDTADAPANSGFGYSLKSSCTTAESSIAANESMVFTHKIEGKDAQRLKYGDSTAEAVTVSFWFRSPKTGIHCVSMYQRDASRSIVTEFTIASANTFEFFSVTFAGDTGGTINNDTGPALELNFPLTVGSNYHDTADAWAGGTGFSTSNQQNLLDSDANNIYFTGVQMEIGSVATDFEHEPISATLAKCKRYYERHTFDSVSGQQIAVARIQTAASTILGFKFDVEKRVDPTFTFTAAATFSLQYNGTTSSALAAISADHITTTQCRIVPGLSSGLTADEAAMWQRDGTDATYMEISADL